MRYFEADSQGCKINDRRPAMISAESQPTSGARNDSLAKILSRIPTAHNATGPGFPDTGPIIITD
jgi:hypothetical protein